MANTTNFNWETPDDTDLVKDGALAIRTLGNSIDTTLVDLKGGTTGQVLSKTSNTDMDFTWVTSDDANAIQNTIVDAKGDLISASAADVPARLAVGNNGETLVADSSTSTGLRWQGTYAAGRNFCINGGMDIWQRGTSVSVNASSTTYTADRWQTTNGANQAMTVSRQATGDTTNLPFVQYCARVQRNSGQTGTGYYGIAQSFETANSVQFAGRIVTLSFYARAGSNYSPTSSLLRVFGLTGTGTDQNALAGYTGGVGFTDNDVTLTTTWQRFTITTSALPTNTSEIGIVFKANATGTASTNDYFEVTGVQLEIGSVATPFNRAGGIAGELQACQRYFYKMTAVSGTDPFGVGTANATTTALIQTALPVTMRVAPTGVYTGTFRLGGGTTITGIAAANLSLTQSFTQQILTEVTTTGLTIGWAMFMLANGDASISLSSEL